MRTELAFMLMLLPATTHAWVSSAQRIHGAQLDQFRATQRGNGTAEGPSLRIWSYPHGQDAPHASQTAVGHGLRGGITWAWDDRLCDHLEPNLREAVFGFSLADCFSLKAAMHRAFESWASNHRLISFVDVTAECRRLSPDGVVTIPSGCPLAEVMVGPSTSDACSLQAARAERHKGYTTSLRYTNGAEAHDWDPATAKFRPRRSIEIKGGSITFGGARTGCAPFCWYLDATFCSGFHNLKRLMSPSAVRVLLLSLVGIITGVALLITLLQACAICQAARKAPKGLRCKHGAGVLVKWSVCATSVRFVCIVTPLLGYTQIFAPCFDCMLTRRTLG